MGLIADNPAHDSVPAVWTNADAGGDWFVNKLTAGDLVLISIVGPLTEFRVSFTNAIECSFGEHPDLVITIPANTGSWVTEGFSQHRFVDPDDGFIHITYPDGAVGIQLAAFRYHAHRRD